MLSTVHNALSESCMFNLYQSGDVDSYFVIVFLDLAVHNFLIVYGKRYKLLETAIYPIISMIRPIH